MGRLYAHNSGLNNVVQAFAALFGACLNFGDILNPKKVSIASASFNHDCGLRTTCYSYPRILDRSAKDIGKVYH